MMIIKIGGGAGINVEGIIKDLSCIEEKFLIVHGANATRDKIARKLGVEVRVLTSVSGYQSVFSDNDAIDVMMMSYSGLVNKRIVELCQRYGINAVGLTGLDGRLVQGKRNLGIRIMENDKAKLLRDQSGKPISANRDLLDLMLLNGYVPVVCPPIVDEQGFAINTENDDIIRVINDAVKADTIIQLIEAPGFLLHKEDESSIVHNMDISELENREKDVEGRMKRKILALRKLMDSGIVRVIISDGRVDNPIRDALAGKGTVIK